MISNEDIVELALKTAETIAANYKIEIEIAHQKVLQLWLKNHQFATTIDDCRTVKELQRTRVYKEIVKTVRRSIYNELRRYRDPNEGEIQIELLASTDLKLAEGTREKVLSGHISTAERGNSIGKIVDKVFSWQPLTRTILDIGSGVMPLQYPFFDGNYPLDQYLAIDKDILSVRAVNSFARVVDTCKLSAIPWRLGGEWAEFPVEDGPELYDVGFVLKFIPLVARQDPCELAKIAQAPVKSFVISGSRVSMTKRRDITRREEKVLRNFIENNNLKLADHFLTPDETIFLVNRAV